MAAVLPQGPSPRLERSCAPPARERIALAPARPGLERAEVFLKRHAFAPHRHDTYALGCTLRGVQAFGYRGVATRSLPGQVFVLHPDELHDGRPGGDDGFGYRILYIAPRLIAEALGPRRGSLPFVRDAVSRDPGLIAAIGAACADFESPLEDLQADQIVADLARALAAAEHGPSGRAAAPPDRAAAGRVRALLDSRLETPLRSAELERVSGLSRYALARHFRASFGTSPYRYLVLRRLDRARRLIAQGHALADAAALAGFADQSHMTRHFKRATGISPGRWRALTAPLSPPAPAPGGAGAPR